MIIRETIEKIINTSLFDLDLKYCLVNRFKEPYKIDNTLARPNVLSDFVDLIDILSCSKLDRYAGLGISIQASNICAIDVDKCFSKANDLSTADDRAKDILNRFKNVAYCEFSFSGTGLRIFFKAPTIENYNEKYYIKNSDKDVEYYQPSKSYRYVTITGNKIYDEVNDFNNLNEVLIKFLDDYMLRPIKQTNNIKKISSKSFEELKKDIRILYLKNPIFQNLWFGQAPGSGHNESELDYQLLIFIYEQLTQDKEMVRTIFESSPYFKSKDATHIKKWEYNNHRYFNYIFSKFSN